MARPNSPFSLVFVLDSARKDGQSQQQRDESLRQAVEFLLELVEHCGAWNEELPRGYRVVKVNGRKKGVKGVVPRVELRRVARGFFGSGAVSKVASRENEVTTLLHTRDFAKHLKSGLLDDLGEFFVARFRKNQRESEDLAASVEHIEAIRRHLKRVESEE